MKDVYVVTGAGSGLGFESAKIFGAKGAVILCGRTKSKIESAVAELKGLGMDAYGTSCDVSDRSSVANLASMASSLGNVRVVVHSAGVSPPTVKADMIYRINLIGTVHVTDAFLPLMRQDSVLINIASMAGHMMPMNEKLGELYGIEDVEKMVETALTMFPEQYAYSVSKRFVLEYTKRCGATFAEKGARVVSISPGTFDTPMLDSTRESDSVKDMKKRTPVGRLGKPIEIAYLAEFLASDKAKFITGTDVLIDGGYLNVMMASMKK